MKKLALALGLLISLSSCSSGSTVAEIPPLITGLYSGGYESLNNRDAGTMIMNLAEDSTTGAISGTLQITFNRSNETCLSNSTITGTITGFSVTLQSPQGGGTLDFQLTASDNTLIGTYVSSGEVCSNFSGSGNVNLSRG